jgi:branched-chain amino acid transport system ATP-binding protein
MSEPVLRIRKLTVEYLRGLPVVDEMSLDVRRGEIVGLFGRNGSGKTTALKAVFGFVARRSGEIELLGRSIRPGTPTYVIARLGATMVIEGRGIFADLTVEENLRSAIRAGDAARLLEKAYALFPMLAPKRHAPAGRLSGGEQQLLAIGRASLQDPRLLILDEPSLGLSPAATTLVMKALRGIAEHGSAVLVADQNYATLNKICSRAYLMANGRIVDSTDDVRSKSIGWAEKVYLVQGG